MEAISVAAGSPANMSLDQLTRFSKLGDQLNYVALLANKGRIDRNYLLQSIDCIAIVFVKIIPMVSEQNAALRSAHLAVGDDLREFAQKAECGPARQMLDEALSRKSVP
jgi:hypothetical protein